MLVFTFLCIKNNTLAAQGPGMEYMRPYYKNITRTHTYTHTLHFWSCVSQSVAVVSPWRRVKMLWVIMMTEEHFWYLVGGTKYAKHSVMCGIVLHIEDLF